MPCLDDESSARNELCEDIVVVTHTSSKIVLEELSMSVVRRVTTDREILALTLYPNFRVVIYSSRRHQIKES
jgi:hypothetical protein